MFETQMDALDAEATLAAADEARAVSGRAEVRILDAAAHWADACGVGGRR